METIGQRIKRRRKDAEFSLPKLAEQAEVAKGYLWELESGRAVRPSANTLFKIATALGTTVADLMGNEVHPASKPKIPQSLRAFAEKERLTDEHVRMLAGVHYRGRRPKTEDDWKFVLESIRRSVRKRSTHTLRHQRNRRTWDSLEALTLTKVTGVEDPILAIKKQANDLIAKGELQGPPTDLRLLASFQRVLRVEPGVMKEAGRLVPVDKGLVIQVNSHDPEKRRNFTVAHEIAHTLLPTYSRAPVFRSDATVATFNRNDEEEYLCDVGASTLLFPEQWFRPRAVDLGASLAALYQLADEFQGSLEATALAWAQLGLWPYAIVFWEKALKPAELKELAQPRLPGLDATPPAPKYRVSRFFRSSGFPDFIPRYKSVADDSVVAKAALSQFDSGTLEIEIDRRLLRFECEAEFAPYNRREVQVPRVISILNPLTPDSTSARKPT